MNEGAMDFRGGIARLVVPGHRRRGKFQTRMEQDFAACLGLVRNFRRPCL